MSEVDWPCAVFDGLRKAVAVIGPRGEPAWASAEAIRLRRAELAVPGAVPGRTDSCLAIQRAAERARPSGGRPQHARVVLAADDSVWQARLWGIGDGYVALALERVHGQQLDVSRIANQLDLLPPQAELARLVAQGSTNRAIADALAIRESSVKARLWRLYRRVGVQTRTELTALLHRL